MRVILGERRVWKGAGAKRKCVVKKDELSYIPLERTLQTYLSNPTFVEQVILVVYVYFFVGDHSFFFSSDEIWPFLSVGVYGRLLRWRGVPKSPFVL